MKTKKLIIEHLYDFLGEDLFNEFEAEYHYYFGIIRRISLDETNILSVPNFIFASAFSWFCSRKGYDFWAQKENEWLEYCKKHKLIKGV